MPFSYQIGKELEEKCKQKQSDMHPINVGIGRNNNIIVSQVFYSVFNIQSRLKKVKLLILIYNFLGKSKAVKGFATETEDSLCFNIPRFCYGTACRVALSYEKGRIKLIRIVGIIMDATVS